MEIREDFESDPVLSFLGAGWTPVEEEHPVLANAENSDEFDPRYADDVEGMLFLGYLSHTFDLLGHNFTIRTLRAGERLAALALTKEFEDTLGLELALQMAMVSASIELVDHRPLYASLTRDEKPIVRIAQQWKHVEGWYEYMIEGVYNEYGNLLMRQGAAFEELRGKSAASRLLH